MCLHLRNSRKNICHNPGADLRGMPSPEPFSGAELRDKVLDAVSSAIHGGAAAYKKEILYPPPRDDNNAGLTPLYPCLKPPFWHQKVHLKPFFTHIFGNIMHKDNNLSGSDPAITTLPLPVPMILLTDLFPFPIKHQDKDLCHYPNRYIPFLCSI